MEIIAALRKVIEKYSKAPLPPIPSDNEKGVYGEIRLQRVASLFDVYDSLCDPQDVIESEQPMGMELVGQVSLKLFIYTDLKLGFWLGVLGYFRSHFFT